MSGVRGRSNGITIHANGMYGSFRPSNTHRARQACSRDFVATNTEKSSELEPRVRMYD
jgi:hypothetical protein